MESKSIMTDIREKKLIYHLTSMNNIGSIIENGLMPRFQLDDFVDVADHEIISNRKRLGLEKLVPFHFFSGNPFDGRVQVDRPSEKFALIAISRSVAKARGWQIIPRHPLANENIELMSYEAGFLAIEWEVMNMRDYHDSDCKSVCMAECLAPGTVSVSDFFKIFVSCEQSQKTVEEQLNRHGVTCRVGINSNMFIS